MPSYTISYYYFLLKDIVSYAYLYTSIIKEIMLKLPMLQRCFTNFSVFGLSPVGDVLTRGRVLLPTTCMHNA
jgi:hypothetical protein